MFHVPFSGQHHQPVLLPRKAGCGATLRPQGWRDRLHFGHMQQPHPDILLLRNYMELSSVQPVGWDMCLMRLYSYRRSRAMRPVH